MRRTEDITFARLGQTLALRVLSGRPVSATFDVLRDVYGDDTDDYDAEFSGSGSVDTVNTTVDQASGPSQSDPHTLYLTSTAGIICGRKYALEENGRKEWVEPVEIATNVSVRCRHALQRDYTTAATLKSTYVTFAIDATWVADEDNLSDVLDPHPDYRLRAEVVNASGETEVHYIFFDLVRAPIDHSVLIQDIAARWPSIMTQLPHDQAEDRWQPMIDACWRSLRAEFAVLGLNDAAIRDHEAVDEALILRFFTMAASAGYAPPQWDVAAFWQKSKDDFNTFWEQNFKVTLKRAIATGTSGGVPQTHLLEQPIWRK